MGWSGFPAWLMAVLLVLGTIALYWPTTRSERMEGTRDELNQPSFFPARGGDSVLFHLWLSAFLASAHWAVIRIAWVTVGDQPPSH
jgi:hypothetical protein